MDEPAMLRALASGKVRSFLSSFSTSLTVCYWTQLYSAGLDVFDCEPDIHPDLVKNEGITLLPQ